MLLKFIKSQDLFGHEVSLNFNKKGSSHNTIIGGAVSVLVKAFMAFYTVLLVKTMVLYQKNNNQSIT